MPGPFEWQEAILRTPREKIPPVWQEEWEILRDIVENTEKSADRKIPTRYREIVSRWESQGLLPELSGYKTQKRDREWSYGGDASTVSASCTTRVLPSSREFALQDFQGQAVADPRYAKHKIREYVVRSEVSDLGPTLGHIRKCAECQAYHHPGNRGGNRETEKNLSRNSFCGTDCSTAFHNRERPRH